MGLGSFLTGFGTGFLRQVNAGYDNQRKLNYEMDLQNAKLIDTLAVSSIDQYNKEEADARDQFEKYNAVASVWGPTLARLWASNPGQYGPEQLARFSGKNMMGPDPQGDYGKQLQDRINTIHSGLLGSVKLAMGDRWKGPSAEQLYPAPSFGGPSTPQGQPQPPSGTAPITPVTTGPLPPQDQTSSAFGMPQGTPQPMAETNSVQLGGGLTYSPPTSATATNQLPVSKYVDSEVGQMFTAYGTQGKDLTLDHNPYSGTINVVFNTPALGQYYQNVRTLVQPFMEQEIIKARQNGLSPSSIDFRPTLNIAREALDLSMTWAQKQSGGDTQKAITLIGSMNAGEFRDLVYKLDHERQTAPAAMNTVGDIIQSKNANPNNPAVQYIRKYTPELIAFMVAKSKNDYASGKSRDNNILTPQAALAMISEASPEEFKVNVDKMLESRKPAEEELKTEMNTEQPQAQ